MMQHVRKDQISAYLDRQLDAQEEYTLEAHFQECESCRAICDEMRELTLLFREAEHFKPSPFLWNRIAAGLDEKAPSARSWRESIILGLRNFGWKSGMAAAILSILMMIGISTFRINSARMAERAALVEIDQIYENLAAQDPDTYNPFSSGSPYRLGAEQNPFRDLRLGSSANTAPKR
jgi:predicted anti-sigma-YlaC factor YlaD